MSILSAIVTDVPIGHLTVPGLMDEQGEFYIEAGYLAQLIRWEVADIESFLNACIGSYNKVLNLDGVQVSAVSLDALPTFFGLAENPKSHDLLEMVDVLQALAFRQLFFDAFNPYIHPVTKKFKKGHGKYPNNISPPKESSPLVGNTASSPKKVPLYVYLITDRTHDICKIGISWNPSERLRGLQSGYPFPLTLEQKMKTTSALVFEKWIHAKFDTAKVSGEWFTLSLIEPFKLRSLAKEWMATTGSNNAA